MAPTGPKVPRFPTWQLIALGILGASAFITEGAATDWSGVHATRVLGASPAVGSIVYALFFAAMTIVRFFGDGSGARLGAGRTVRIAGAVAATGYGLVLLSGVVAIELPVQLGCAVTGWALAGAGMAVIWPVVISTLGAAGADASRLSLVTMISYGGGLVGPALIGHVADATSLSTVLLIPAGLAVLVAGTAPLIVRGTRRPAMRPDERPPSRPVYRSLPDHDQQRRQTYERVGRSALRTHLPGAGRRARDRADALSRRPHRFHRPSRPVRRPAPRHRRGPLTRTAATALGPDRSAQA